MYPSVLLSEALRKFIPIAIKNGMNQKRLKAMLASPYLTYQSHSKDSGFSGEDADAVRLMSDDGIVRTPFLTFRFCVQTESGDQFCGICERIDGHMDVIGFCRPKGKLRGPVFYHVFIKREQDDVKCDGVVWDENRNNITEEFLISDDDKKEGGTKDAVKECHDISEEFKRWPRFKQEEYIRNLKRTYEQKKREIKHLRIGINGLHQYEEEVKTIITPLANQFTRKEDPVQNHAISFYEVIKVVCYEYLAPQNFMAVVRPAGTQNHSVEWLKAREHITLIHRHHEANSSEVCTGQTVLSDEKRLIQRIAHSRRAHFKILRSPRFKFKQGQRIAVRASWVGPKEWKDTAGQTYQILEQVTQPTLQDLKY